MGAVALAGALPALAAACAPGDAPGPSAGTSVPEVPATTVPGTPPFPRTVAVRDDHAVVIVNRDGTVARTLVPAGGTPIGGVTLSADGRTAYYDQVNGSALTVYQVPTDGSGAPQAYAQGGSPEASATGNEVAYLTTTQVVVRDNAAGTQRAWALPGPASNLAWTSNGAKLLWVQGQAQLMTLDVGAGAGARPQAVPGAAAGPGEKLYAILGGDGAYRVGSGYIGAGLNDTSVARVDAVGDGTVQKAPVSEDAGYRDRAVDASGHWSIRVDALHNLRWAVGGGTGLVGKGYLFADM